MEGLGGRWALRARRHSTPLSIKKTDPTVVLPSSGTSCPSRDFRQPQTAKRGEKGISFRPLPATWAPRAALTGHVVRAAHAALTAIYSIWPCPDSPRNTRQVNPLLGEWECPQHLPWGLLQESMR